MGSASWNRQKAGHLYRRAGFGGSTEDLDRAVADGRESAVSRLVDYESISTADLDSRIAAYRFDLESYRSIAIPEESRLAYEQFVNVRRWWYLRMIYTPRPLEEKLTLFWHNHFPTSWAKVDTVALLYAQNRLFRTRAAGRFEDLLMDVARDRAMLFYLDNNTNVKGAIQENWGRELLELFTMGVNRYTQEDVRAAAAAFTGWTTQFEPPYAFYFDPDRHEFGFKTFLGQVGDFDGADIIRIVAARPETAEYLTTKLARFFLARHPRRPLARRLLDVYFETRGSVREIVRAILLSDDFEEAGDARDQVKSPVELIVGALRSVAGWTDGNNLADYAGQAGQNLFLAPNVAGWPAYTYGGRRWFHTAAYFARMRFANDLAVSRAGLEVLGFTWNIESFFRNAAISDADSLIDFAAARLGMMPISAGLRGGLRDFLAHAGRPIPWDEWGRDRWGRGVLRLLFSSPEYQLQ